MEKASDLGDQEIGAPRPIQLRSIVWLIPHDVAVARWRAGLFADSSRR